MAGIRESAQTILTQNSQVGEASDAPSLADRVNEGLSIKNFGLEEAYSGKTQGVVDGPGGIPISPFGTDSLFNPFYVFKYSKFASTDGSTYDFSRHKDVNVTAINPTSILSNADKLAGDHQNRVENPSAGTIIQWAKDNGDKDSSATTLAPIPYQLNDFLWCKWYGKIPNNRLLTLRRYPIPVSDSIQIAAQKSPLVPLAQAVTWWGGETGNSLSGVLGMTYGFRWKNLTTSDVQNIEGNEITAENLLDTLGINDQNSNLRKLLLATIFQDPNKPFQSVSGYEQKLQQWAKESYGNEGAYWNRIFGPINVIDSTQMRDAGYDFTNTIDLTFSYKLRSFGNVNPKIAMLDLIGNFMALTYNRASFWGGSGRYYQKTGFTLAGLPVEKFNQGDFAGGVADILKYGISSFQGKSQELSKVFQELLDKGQTEGFESAANAIVSQPIVQKVLGSWVKDLVQTPLKMRSILDGRDVGEWHLTVGNPMNPVAVIGNLCLKSTTMTFSDALGMDDFPTEVTFKVQLDHGRPRAKQDIESMFNLGAGDMFFSHLPPPSSASNSFGERNGITANAAIQGVSPDEAARTAGVSIQGNEAQIENQSQSGQTEKFFNGFPNAESAQNASDLIYKPRVRRAYGDKFANSPSLPDYFRDLKTKD